MKNPTISIIAGATYAIGFRLRDNLGQPIPTAGSTFDMRIVDIATNRTLATFAVEEVEPGVIRAELTPTQTKALPASSVSWERSTQNPRTAWSLMWVRSDGDKIPLGSGYARVSKI